MSHGSFLYVIIFCCIHSPKSCQNLCEVHPPVNPPQGVSSPHHGGFTFSSWNGGSWDLVGFQRQAGRAMQLRGGSFRMCPVPEDLDVTVKVSSLSNPNGEKTKTSFFCCFFSLFYYWMRTPGFWSGVISGFGKQRFEIYIYISLYTYIYIYTHCIDI